MNRRSRKGSGMNPFLRGAVPPKQVMVIGHRGCAGAPENTIAAFRKAAALGADMVEFDVREGLVVSHDATRRRRPALREVLAFLGTTELYINIEIKIPGIARDVVTLVEKLGLTDRVIVSSFLHDQVALAKGFNPGIAGGVLSQDRLVDPGRYVREIVRADIYSPGRGVFQRADGVGTHVWTVNDPDEMRALVAAGVTGIFTDYPARLRKILSTGRRTR